MPGVVPQAFNPQGMPSDYFRLQRKIYRWSDQTRFVMVYINTATFLPDWQPYNPQIVRDALTEWQHAINNRLMFVFTNDPSQADVNINWWNTSQPGVDEGAAGLNQFQTWGHYIAKNDIYLSLHNFDGTPWTAQQIYGFALHEIGHMLGIHEHSDDPRDIMFAQISEQNHLSMRDIATLNHIYATKANFTNPPGYHLARFNDFRKTQKPTSIPIPILIPSFL